MNIHGYLWLPIVSSLLVSCASAHKDNNDLRLPRGETLDEPVTVHGMFVLVPVGWVKLELFVESAKLHLAKRYKNFVSTGYRTIRFDPADTNRCVTVTFSGDLGEPYWLVSFDVAGKISRYQTGISRDAVVGQ